MLDQLTPLLKTSRLGREAEFHRSIDSTNRRALDWAAAGGPDGGLVLADHQTAGRGRLGRTWTDEAGASLLFSVVLRPGMPPARLGLVGLAAALAAAEAIEPLAGRAQPELKWPNDVLLAGRKVAGVLPEARVRGVEMTVAVGIGVNVNQASLPIELEPIATSLRRVAGEVIERPRLLADILERLELWLDRMHAGRYAGIVAAFQDRMRGIGQAATVSVSPESATTGTIEGLAPDGALLLRTADGLRRLHAGEVTPYARNEAAEATS